MERALVGQTSTPQLTAVLLQDLNFFPPRKLHMTSLHAGAGSDLPLLRPLSNGLLHPTLVVAWVSGSVDQVDQVYEVDKADQVDQVD